MYTRVVFFSGIFLGYFFEIDSPQKLMHSYASPQIILDQIEAIENINHDEYVENESYYNLDSDDYDDDDN